MRAIGFNQKQYGDLVISTVAARAFKQKHPNSHLTLGIHKNYHAISELFKFNEFFDDVHFYSGDENWPDEQDKKYLDLQQFDIVFNAMPKRPNESNWWQSESQVENICTIFGLQPPDNLQCSLTQWFDTPDYNKCIAFAPFGAWPHYPNNKSLSVTRAQEIVDFILSQDLGVWQLGHPNEPKLRGTIKNPLTYVENIRSMLGTRGLVTIDSGVNWVASAYSFPTLGLYSNSYYSPKYVCNIQPHNQNAMYLDAPNVNDINIELIKEKIIELIK